MVKYNQDKGKEVQNMKRVKTITMLTKDGKMVAITIIIKTVE